MPAWKLDVQHHKNGTMLLKTVCAPDGALVIPAVSRLEVFKNEGGWAAEGGGAEGGREEKQRTSCY